MPGPLKNARHERFAQERAKGKSVDAAYKVAGFKPHRGNAHRLSTNESVNARVAELQGRAAEKAVLTASDIAAQLDEDRAFARKMKAPAAMVSASLGKAKVLGLIVDRSEHTGKNGGPIEYKNLSDEEIEARILALKAGDGPGITTH